MCRIGETYRHRQRQENYVARHRPNRARADLVVVDAAHDFDNEYADLKLALAADPDFIFVDDANAEQEAKPAIEKFLDDLKDRFEYTFPIGYEGGGLVIKLHK